MPRKPKTETPLPSVSAADLALQRQPVMFALKHIHVAAENPRHDFEVEEIEALADSIASAGILMPLIGYTHPVETSFDDVRITVGGRRTRALQLLWERGAWDRDETCIPVILMDREEAVQAGVNEQLSHVAMSDKDVLRAFTLPYYASLSNADCGRKMGLTAREVAKRRRVLELPEEILDALWDGHLTADQAIGLTYWIESPEVLNDFFEQAIDNPEITAAHMREEFTSEYPLWQDYRKAAYTTEAAYLAAGGRLQADLFAGGQMILDLDVLDRLAEEAVVANLAATHTRRKIFFTEAYPGDTHRGVTDITPEERDELDGFYADLPRQKAEPERYAELRAKVQPTFPDELLALLDLQIRWLPPSHAEPFYTYDKLLPPPAEREALYEGGWLRRPTPAQEKKLEQGASLDVASTAKEKDPLAATGTTLAAVDKILAHAHRQALIANPHAAVQEWLKHLSKRLSCVFSTVASESEHDFTDLPVIFHKDWTKASAMAKDDDATIMDYTPAQVRLMTAWRVLSCLNVAYAKAKPLTAKEVRRWFAPDEKFMARYTSKQLIAMLGGGRVRELTQSIAGVPNKNQYVKAAVKMAREEPDFLPIGFPQYRAEGAPAAPAPVTSAEDRTAFAAEVAAMLETGRPPAPAPEVQSEDLGPTCGNCGGDAAIDEDSGETWCLDGCESTEATPAASQKVAAE